MDWIDGVAVCRLCASYECVWAEVIALRCTDREVGDHDAVLEHLRRDSHVPVCWVIEQANDSWVLADNKP